jgi:hypothetical protein
LPAIAFSEVMALAFLSRGLQNTAKGKPMRHIRRSLFLFLVLVAIATSSFATSKSQPEFDRIKSLAGN